jgi:hypothetical protein
MKRLEGLGLAEKQEKRYLLSKDLRKKQLKAARAR